MNGEVQWLLERAAELPLIRRSAHALAGENEEALTAALTVAAERRDQHLVTLLAFALGERRGLTLAEAMPLLPEVMRLDHMVGLLGLVTEAPIAMVLAALDEGRLSSEREAVAVMAAGLLGGEEARSDVSRWIRILWQRAVGPEARMMLVAAAGEVGDEHARAAVRSDEMSARARDTQVTWIRELLDRPLEALDEVEPAHVTSGFTVRRTVPRIGRNEPCPCGSGKKYKKCCLKADSKRMADPSPVPGMTMQEYRTKPPPEMSTAEIRAMRPAEIAQLDLSQLTGSQLAVAFQQASVFREWSLAGKALDAMDGRTDLPHDWSADDYRMELIDEASMANRYDVVQEHASRVDEPMDGEITLGLALAFDAPDALDQLESCAQRAMTDSGQGIALAFALLARHRALGILVSRAVLDPGRLLDADTLLGEVEEARAHLNLPPDDIGWDLLQWLERRQMEEGISSLSVAVNEKLAAQLAKVHLDAEQKDAEVTRLERELRRRTAALEKIQAESVSATPPTQSASPVPDSGASERLSALRTKVSELKGQISEGNSERRRLRAELSDLAIEASEQPDQVEDEDDGLENDVAEPVSRVPLVPVWTAEARSDLTRLASGASARAIGLAGALGARDAAGWSQVKQLASLEGVMSARVGLGHRLLFRASGKNGDLDRH
ncbi:MAG: hypothetical protein ACI9WU_003712, partial [Myxococcota bacterium]